MDLTRFQQQLKGTSSKARPLPPVEQWNPDFCGDINLTIALDGRWFYEGSPIGRASLVQLFASVLKREGDKYFLVTPVEKVGITVEDTPFLVTQWHREQGESASDSTYVFTTQTGDIVRLERADQLELRVPPKPYKIQRQRPFPTYAFAETCVQDYIKMPIINCLNKLMKNRMKPARNLVFSQTASPLF